MNGIGLHQLKGKCVILVKRLGLHYNPYLSAEKLQQELKLREIRTPTVNQQCVVYSFTWDLCDSDYVG